MRTATILAITLAAARLHAQEPVPHVVAKPAAVSSAPATGATPAAPIAQITRGTAVDVIGRDRDWVRIRLEGWVRESDLITADTLLRTLSAADVRSNPEAARGKVVRWEVEAVSLQTADALRTGMRTGEPYLLALGPGAEKTLVYLAVPAELLVSARSLPPLTPITVTARVRNGRSEPAGVPILDILSLTRR